MNKYELHVTVDSSCSSVDLAKFVAPLHGKVIDIQLSHGLHKRQLMAGFNFTKYEPGFAFWTGGRLLSLIAKEFKVTRGKIEGHPDNDDEPVKPLYLEAHWKVKKGISRSLVSSWTETMPVLVSFNNAQPDIEYWTMRSTYPMRPLTFKKNFHGVSRSLADNLIKPGHMEVALLDTNIKLDEGWDPDV